MERAYPIVDALLRSASAEGRLKVFVFLSPHRDDIAFSASSFVERLKPSLVANLYTRSCYTASGSARYSPSQELVEEVSALRAREDQTYFAAVAVNWVDFGAEEPSLRGRKSRDPIGISDDLQQIAGPLSALLDMIEKRADIELIAPAGIGGHVNHLAARAFALNWYEAAPDRRGLAFYEDLPYARRWRVRMQGVRNLKTFAGAHQIVRTVQAVTPRKLDYINMYPSQHGEPVTRLRRFSPAVLWPLGPHEALWRVI